MLTHMHGKKEVLPARSSISMSVTAQRCRQALSNLANVLTVAWAQAPESVAYGLLAFAPLGLAFGPQAMALALLGAVVANAVASLAGGGRVITGPRAALALLTAALVQVIVQHRGPAGPLPLGHVLGLLALGVGGAGLLQMLFGLLRLGAIVKFTPHPVRVGLTSGVGLLLVVSALPAALGQTFGGGLAALRQPMLPAALLVAMVAAGVTWAAARWRAPLPPVLAGLLAGSSLQALLLWTGGAATGPMVGVPAPGLPWPAQLPATADAWLPPALVLPLALFSLTVATLGSLDTLLAVSVVDGRLRQQRDADRELQAQGLANLLAGLAGGLPNSPSVQRSLALLDATPGLRHGALGYAGAVLALLMVAPGLLGWLPVAAIGGVLVLQGLQTVDGWLWRMPLALLRRGDASAAGRLDAIQRRLLRDNWGVAALVMLSSLVLGLAVAVLVGAAFAVLLFVRSNIRPVVRSQRSGGERRSLKVRPPQAVAALDRVGHRIAVLELQGALFFGTADALRDTLASLPPESDFAVLDLYLVSEIDTTGGRILLEMAGDWARRGKQLVATEWAAGDPRRGIVEAIAHTAGLPPLRFAPDTDQALEAAEDQLLDSCGLPRSTLHTLSLADTQLAQGLAPAELAVLAAELETVHFISGETMFLAGEPADALYVSARGDIGIRLPGGSRRLVSFAPGTIVGEMAALERGLRSADAVAETALTAWRLPVNALERLQRDHPALASRLLVNIARHLSVRLRGLTHELSTWMTRTAVQPLPVVLASLPDERMAQDGV